MYVNQIIEDCLIGSTNRIQTFVCNSRDQIIAAVYGLDGNTKSLILLQGDGKTRLTVGGGNDGRYVVQIQYGIDERFLTLTDPTKSRSESLEVTSGGQSGLYVAQNCVDRDAALKACLEFAENGEPSPSQRWEEDGGARIF